MLSFLIKINKLGSIEQIVWSDPVDVVSDAGTIHQLFARGGKSELLKAIKRGSHREDAFFCDAPLSLRDRPGDFSVAFVSMSSGFLVFAAESLLPWQDESSVGYRAILLMFLNMLKGCLGKIELPGGKKPRDREQAEMIQTLMGELRDRKNLLQEANDQLNTINQDLNNRLVKDSLTGLVSRYQYRAEMELLIGGDPQKLGVFVFIDIDDFKSVNDRYGHAAGDQYLIEFAERLKRIPLDGMVRMRISGDEFGLFLYGLEEYKPTVAEDIWQKLKTHVLSKPIVALGRSLPVSISAGMAVYGVDTTEIYELIECADHAMYAAKRKGKNRYSVYNMVK